MKEWKDNIKLAVRGWPTTLVSATLLLVGIGLIVAALVPGHAFIKSGVLAWVLLP